VRGLTKVVRASGGYSCHSKDAATPGACGRRRVVARGRCVLCARIATSLEERRPGCSRSWASRSGGIWRMGICRDDHSDRNRSRDELRSIDQRSRYLRLRGTAWDQDRRRGRRVLDVGDIHSECTISPAKIETVAEPSVGHPDARYRRVCNWYCFIGGLSDRRHLTKISGGEFFVVWDPIHLHRSMNATTGMREVAV
jgi:hypothetical protein